MARPESKREAESESEREELGDRRDDDDSDFGGERASRQRKGDERAREGGDSKQMLDGNLPRVCVCGYAENACA